MIIQLNSIMKADTIQLEGYGIQLAGIVEHEPRN